MPRESCITHSADDYFIVIRRSYVRLLDGDHCAAALLSLFEYFTNGEIQRLKLAEEDSEPWIRASFSRILNDLMDHYSERYVREALVLLKTHDLISEAQYGTGTVKRYLLNLDRLRTLKSSGAVLIATGKKEGVSSTGKKEGVEGENPGKNTGKKEGVEGCYKEEELRTKKEEQETLTPSPPSGPKTDTEDLNMEDPIETFTRNLYNQKRRLRLKFTTGEGKKLAERLQRAEERAGPEEFRRGLIAYLEENSDWAFTNKWPLAGFLKRVESNGEYSRARTAAPIRSVPAPRMAVSHAPPAIPPAAPNGVPKGESGLPVPVEIWNRIVTAGPSVQEWDCSNGYHKLLKENWHDQRFRDNFDKFCVTCQEILVLRGSGELWWMTFLWLLKPANWFKFVSGQMEPMAKVPEQRPQRTYKSAGAKATEDALRMLSERKG